MFIIIILLLDSSSYIVIETFSKTFSKNKSAKFTFQASRSHCISFVVACSRYISTASQATASQLQQPRLVNNPGYLKIAIRNFKRHKGYSFINLAGFAIGMMCCLLIFLYIRHETSYDNYHKDGDRVYRIVQDIRTQTSNRVFAPISPMVGPTLKADFPQVEQSVRVITAGSRLVRKEDVYFYEDLFMWADQELFDVLTIPFIRGNPQDALSRPQTVVITKRMAEKYFGHGEAMEQLLTINQQDYEVTGVLANPPENTHLKYDLIASLETLADWNEMNNWYSTMFYTYLKLRPNVDVDEFSLQVSHIADKYIGDFISSRGSEYYYFLQPVSDIHLKSNISYEAEPKKLAFVRYWEPLCQEFLLCCPNSL